MKRYEYVLSLSDPGGDEKGTLWIDSAYDAMKSRSADDLEKAFDKWTDRTNNYPYADTDKNFGYKFAGSVPVRHSQHEWGVAKGLEKRYSTVYIDGVKMLDPSSSDGSFYLENIMKNGIDRVEVLKGTQSSLYGSNAIGGTINIFTKKGMIN